MKANHTIKTISGLLLASGFVAAGTEPKGEAIRQYQPGDQWVYRINATMEGTNPNGEKLNIPMTGMRTITILPQKYKSPKGILLLQREQVTEREITFRGQTRKETTTEIVLMSYDKDGVELVHGIIEKDTPQWVQNANGYAASGLGRIDVGSTFDSGEIKKGDRTRSVKFTVKRKEQVTVPAGTYHAYVCEGTSNDSRAGKSEAIMWVAPQVGTVKMVFKGGQGNMKLSMTLELAKVKLQKAPAKPAQPRKVSPKTPKSKPKK